MHVYLHPTLRYTCGVPIQETPKLQLLPLHLPFPHIQILVYAQKSSIHEKQFQKQAKSTHTLRDDQRTKRGVDTKQHLLLQLAKKRKY
jgi:hypothetical protein